MSFEVHIDLITSMANLGFVLGHLGTTGPPVHPVVISTKLTSRLPLAPCCAGQPSFGHNQAAPRWALPRHVNPEISPVVRILPAPWGLPGGNWWLSLSDRAVGGPEPPSVTSAGVQETTSLICDHGGEVPRGSGPVGRMAPGASAEHAGAQTPHELQLAGGAGQATGEAGPARRRG
jgi:hypothetical protein